MAEPADITEDEINQLYLDLGDTLVGALPEHQVQAFTAHFRAQQELRARSDEALGRIRRQARHSSK